MKTEEEIILTQVKLMEEAVSILSNRIGRFEPTNEEKRSITSQESLTRIFIINSLKIYRRTLAFTAKQAASTDPERHIFSIPHVRTLIDIYSKLLHLQLNCKNDEERALLCLTQQILIHKKLKTPTSLHPYDVYRDFITQTSYPEISQISKNWAKNNKRTFESSANLLTTENINRFSTEVIRVFGSQYTYDLYADFSEQLHGNPFYYQESVHNERLWIISISIVNTAFLFELIDRYFLNIGQPKDFRQWLKSAERERGDYIKMWIVRRQQRQLQNNT